MADFRPLTSVEFYSSTGVNDENQPYFNAEGTKLAWYRAHNVQVVGQENYSYQRENRNTIRVNGKAENFRKYDMMGFKNEAGKWVLCRINEVNFLNPNCVEIVYAVDYLQTYCEDIIFGECWVEREMQANDWNSGVPGFNNLQPEGIEAGERQEDEIWTYEFNNLVISIVSALDENASTDNITRTVEGGIPIAQDVTTFSVSSTGQLSSILNAYAEKNRFDAISGIYLHPRPQAQSTSAVNITYGPIDGYTPINAKCYTGEFCTLVLGTRIGQQSELKPELLGNKSTLNIGLTYRFFAGAGGVLAFPGEYNCGDPRGMGVFYPVDCQLPYSSQGYYNWLGVEGPAFLATSLMNIMGKALVGGPALAGMGAITSATQAVSSMSQSLAHPLFSNSGASGDLFNMGTGISGFYLHWVTPTAANIKCIDDYFSRFGYRTNRFKLPNVHTRPKWNFVKTAGANIRGPFPKSAQEAIVKTMDNGVTFWHLAIGENITDSWDPAQNKEGA